VVDAMDDKTGKYPEENRCSAERDKRLVAELYDVRSHEVEPPLRLPAEPHPFYGYGDMAALQDGSSHGGAYTAGIRSLDQLLDRDRLRKKTASREKYVSGV
jgi:hypothetical protein